MARSMTRSAVISPGRAESSSSCSTLGWDPLRAPARGPNAMSSTTARLLRRAPRADTRGGRGPRDGNARAESFKPETRSRRIRGRADARTVGQPPQLIARASVAAARRLPAKSSVSSSWHSEARAARLKTRALRRHRCPPQSSLSRRKKPYCSKHFNRPPRSRASVRPLQSDSAPR
jgi:hypothetical protein